MSIVKHLAAQQDGQDVLGYGLTIALSPGKNAVLLRAAVVSLEKLRMIRGFLARSEGQDLVEYALLVAVVALGAAAALTAFRAAIVSAWATISAGLSG